MKAQCPKCETKYNIPDDKITEKGLPTKCSKCGTIFRVFSTSVMKQVQKTPLGEDDSIVSQDIEPPDETKAPEKSVEPEVKPSPEPEPEPEPDKGTVTQTATIKPYVRLYQNGLNKLYMDSPETDEEAKKDFEKVLVMKKDDLRATARLNQIEINAGRHTWKSAQRSQAGCRAASDLYKEYSDSALAILVYADCLHYKKSFAQAESLIKQSISLEDKPGENDGEAYLLMALIYDQRGDKENTRLNLEHAVQLENGLFLAHHMLAAIHAAAKEYQIAVKQETSALKINPNHEQGKAKLAEYEKKLKDQLEEEKFTKHLKASNALRREGKFKEAMDELNEALKIRPGSVMALNQKGWMLIDGNPSAALDAFGKAAGNGSTDAYYGKGVCYQALGQNPLAISAFETYLSQSPGGRHAGEVHSILKHLKGN